MAHFPLRQLLISSTIVLASSTHATAFGTEPEIELMDELVELIPETTPLTIEQNMSNTSISGSSFPIETSHVAIPLGTEHSGIFNGGSVTEVAPSSPSHQELKKTELQPFNKAPISANAVFNQKYIFANLLPMHIGEASELKNILKMYCLKRDASAESSPELSKGYDIACTILSDYVASYMNKMRLDIADKYKEASDEGKGKEAYLLFHLQQSNTQLASNIAKFTTAAKEVVDLTRQKVCARELVALIRAEKDIPLAIPHPTKFEAAKTKLEKLTQELEFVIVEMGKAAQAFESFAQSAKQGHLQEAREQLCYGSGLKQWIQDRKIELLPKIAEALFKYYEGLILLANSAGNIEIKNRLEKAAGPVKYVEDTYQSVLAQVMEEPEMVQSYLLEMEYCIQVTEARAAKRDSKNLEVVSQYAKKAEDNFKKASQYRGIGHKQHAQAYELEAKCYLQMAQAYAEGQAIINKLSVVGNYNTAASYAKQARLELRTTNDTQLAQAYELRFQCKMQIAQAWAQEGGLQKAKYKNFQTAADYVNRAMRELHFASEVTTAGAAQNAELIQALELAVQYYMGAAQALLKETEEGKAKAEIFKIAAKYVAEAVDKLRIASGTIDEQSAQALKIEAENLIEQAKDFVAQDM